MLVANTTLQFHMATDREGPCSQRYASETGSGPPTISHVHDLDGTIWHIRAKWILMGFKH